MINVSGNIWEPSPGYKYISNGNTWSDSIRLGCSDSVDNWHDTNDEPPEPVDDDATVEDYEVALHDLGVDV